MKINKISLINFGSYEGENIFETIIRDEKNIVLVGGKNGAGKTTLFTAIRLCLYGYVSMGYKNKTSFYNKEIVRLINNSAKLKKPAEATVSLNISLSNGQELDLYEITRSWVLNDTLSEEFKVTKNGQLLEEEATADFQKYIFSLIPPELFNLFFFDGEKIADFFINEGSDKHIKNAFLTLCGYDTFEIMKRNFERVGNKTSSSVFLAEYVEVKEELRIAKEDRYITEQSIETTKQGYLNSVLAIEALDKSYKNSGGITHEEWNLKLLKLKEEEKRRESINASLKKWANDIIPFLMLKSYLIKIKKQIELENNRLKYENFEEIFKSPRIKKILEMSMSQNQLSEIEKEAYINFGTDTPRILDLSFEKSAKFLSFIDTVLSFDEVEIEKHKKALKKSRKASEKIRFELENSSIAHVQQYMDQKENLYKEQNDLLKSQLELEKALNAQIEKINEIESYYLKCKSNLEVEIKKSSVNDIAAKSLMLLDSLQKSLYSVQIKKVEKLFKRDIKMLMRKTQFIDDIHIDSDFTIHIYKTDSFSANELLELLNQNSHDEFIALLGEKALVNLKKLYCVHDYTSIINSMQLITNKDFEINLPVEIDKTSLSNGEKQIFIMALYHALVQLCNLEIPFIIDTPFARIDTEHRENISKYFFKKLHGQVFVLSTNEEINDGHVKLLQDKIAYTYILENSDNKKTTIMKDSYFREAL